MEFKELKTKKESELHRLLSDLRDKLRDLRFKDANKQLKDVREIRIAKKTIAKILTLLNRKDKGVVVDNVASEQEKSNQVK